ncbi:MAG: type I methionyl aminopeptidase [bacterium]
MVRIKKSSELEGMRRAGRALAEVFFEIIDMVQPGVSTEELDERIEKAIRDKGGIPAFKGYRGGSAKPYPAASCISIEQEIVHGIPGKRQLEEGQLVGIDVGLQLDGYYADMAGSFLVGECDKVRRSLIRVTREALYRGIDQAREGQHLSDIGKAIQSFVEANGFNVIRELVGHGIGVKLHEDPVVPNYFTPVGDMVLLAGMTLAIEPMVSAASWKIRILDDGWTAVTEDGAPSCHFEHTVLVTKGDPEILTLADGRGDPWKHSRFNE